MNVSDSHEGADGVGNLARQYRRLGRDVSAAADGDARACCRRRAARGAEGVSHTGLMAAHGAARPCGERDGAGHLGVSYEEALDGGATDGGEDDGVRLLQEVVDVDGRAVEAGGVQGVDEGCLDGEDARVLVHLAVQPSTHAVKIGELVRDAVVEGDVCDGRVDDAHGVDDTLDSKRVVGPEDSERVPREVVELVDVEAGAARVHEVDEEALGLGPAARGREWLVRVQAANEDTHERDVGGEGRRKVAHGVVGEDTVQESNAHGLVRPAVADELFKEVGEGAVAEVVHESGDLDAEHVVVVDAGRVEPLQVARGDTAQVRDAERVFSAGVRRRRVDKGAHAQLPDAVEAVEDASAGDGGKERWEPHVAVHAVCDTELHFFFCKRLYQSGDTPAGGTNQSRITLTPIVPMPWLVLPLDVDLPVQEVDTAEMPPPPPPPSPVPAPPKTLTPPDVGPVASVPVVGRRVVDSMSTTTRRLVASVSVARRSICAAVPSSGRRTLLVAIPLLTLCLLLLASRAHLTTVTWMPSTSGHQPGTRTRRVQRIATAGSAAALGFAVGLPSVPGVVDNIVLGLVSGLGTYFGGCDCDDA